MTLDGQPSVVVGDRAGNLFAFNLGNPTQGSGPFPSPGTPVTPAGWSAVRTQDPIDSTPSVTPNGTEVLVGSGNACEA